MRKAYGVYGCSGLGRETLPLVRSQLGEMEPPPEGYDLAFIDDGWEGKELHGTTVHRLESFLKLPADEHFAVVAIGDPATRQKVMKKCRSHGIRPLHVQAQNAVIHDNVAIGEGALLCPFVTLTSDIQIGKGFQANLYSYVGHDCVIGDYVTFAPRVSCNGNVHIEDHAYIGTGAIFKNGKPGKPLRIGKGAVVGAGAVVTKNVPPGTTVFGNPAVELNAENLDTMRKQGQHF